MAIKKNKVKVNLGSYPHYILMGEAKIGKTTTVYELAKKEYNLDEMLLISCGTEQGFKSLADIQYEEVLKFDKKEDANGDRGFIQVVDDIVKNYKDYGLKMVVIDTLDTLFDIAIEQVMLESRQQTGKPSKSLNDCFGGYMRGRDRLLEIVTNQIHKLDRLPIAVFILGHTKFKTKKDTLTTDEYEQLTTNLRFDFYSPIANSAQMIVNIATERVIEDGIQVDAKRYMYFTSDGKVDCGSRFNGLPDKLELSADNFMKAFKIGVENSLKDIDKQNIDEIRKEEIKEQEKEVEKIQDLNLDIPKITQELKELERDKSKELRDKIKELAKDKEGKSKLLAKMKKFNKTKITELTIEELEEIRKELQ